MKSFLLLLALFVISKAANAERLRCYKEICEGDKIKASSISREYYNRLHNRGLYITSNSTVPEHNAVRIDRNSVEHKVIRIDKERRNFRTVVSVRLQSNFTVVVRDCYFTLLRDNSYGRTCEDAPRNEWVESDMNDILCVSGNIRNLRHKVRNR